MLNRAMPILLMLLAGCSDESADTPSVESIQQLQQRSQAFAGRSATELLQDSVARTLAGELYGVHCTGCHGGNGDEPKRGIPDLAGAVLHHGDSEAAIRDTIRDGRQSAMPAFGGEMSEVELGAVVALVRSFGSGEALANYGETAVEQFNQHCVQCHGSDGKGNTAVGVPDLTDDYWLHGESMMNVRLTITGGVDAQCPPQAGMLDTATIELLTAHVLDLRSNAMH